MFEAVSWFLISGIVATVSVFLWRKSVLDKKLIWLVVAVAMCLIMVFGVGPCFKAELARVTGVFVIIPPGLWLARIYLVDELERSKNHKMTISRIKKTANVLIGGFWFAFAFALALLYL